MAKSRLERFMLHVRVCKGRRCWPWLGSRFRNGYGQFAAGRLAHIEAWELSYGSRRGMLVLHQCDTRLSVRPSHLWLGTYQDNSDDMVKKQRQVRGEDVHGHKLTRSEVLSIRRLCKMGWVKALLAKKFKISPAMVTLIVKRKSWRHI